MRLIPAPFLALLVLVVAQAGCAKSGGAAPDAASTAAPAVAWQNSTIEALLDGNYDGEVTFAELRKHGDFGLGTFDALDGEMLAVGGNFYQVTSDGEVFGAAPDQRTPFSVVTFFRPKHKGHLYGPMRFAEMHDLLDDMRLLVGENSGRAFAIQIRGRFDAVRTRSVPRQRKPYRPLAEVVNEQATFDFKDLDGTLVGFWFPPTLRNVNVPGYHFHFINEDATGGGHVLDFTVRSGTIEYQELSAVHVALPHRPPATRPTTDRARELEAVEK
jgi:acetolactate decarboxylase